MSHDDGSSMAGWSRPLGTAVPPGPWAVHEGGAAVAEQPAARWTTPIDPWAAVGDERPYRDGAPPGRTGRRGAYA
ncbi:MAG: hypothetical protein ACRDWI_18830, partial [Jiangellaceae bacterium]